MIPIRLKLEIEQPPDVAIRVWRNVLRRAHEVQGRHWADTYLPKHFTGQNRYRYRAVWTDRSRGHQKKKQNMARRGMVARGGRVDLVFSGLTERVALSSSLVRGYPTRATVLNAVPAYITRRSRKTGRADRAREMTAVNAQEERDLSELLERTAVRLLASAPRKKTVQL